MAGIEYKPAARKHPVGGSRRYQLSLHESMRVEDGPHEPAGTALLLDLDGTLLDTAPDMGGALNLLRVEGSLEPLPASTSGPSCRTVPCGW